MRFPLIAQRIGIASAAILALSVAAFEGRELVVYRDIGGVPTVCDGITGRDVIPGKRYTDAECDALLDKHLDAHTLEMLACVRVPLSDREVIAWSHFSYNVGAANFCRSTAAKLLNAGDRIGACNQIPRWAHVAGKDCRIAANKCSGIVRRRAWEQAMCLPPDFSNVTSGVTTTARIAV